MSHRDYSVTLHPPKQRCTGRKTHVCCSNRQLSVILLYHYLTSPCSEVCTIEAPSVMHSGGILAIVV